MIFQPNRIAAVLALAVLPSAYAQTDVSAPEVVSALEGNFGVTPGERRNHIKGTCASGEFVGLPEGAKYSRSALFSGKPVPVVVRFSIAGGNPKIPDTAKNPRGMAVEFKLPNNQLQHMTMLNTPMFGVADPKAFLDLTLATRNDPATGRPDPEKIRAFRAAHPENAGQTQFLDRNNPPASYGTSAYFGIHTFRFIGANGATTLVKWQFVPEDGEKRLTDDEMKTIGGNFLEPALIERAKRGPIRWDMWLTIGQPGDEQNNPTVMWPDARQKVKIGTLSLTAATPQKGAECERINFDPMVMADGIAPTDDPVLRFRSPAYAVSFGKRLSGQ